MLNRASAFALIITVGLACYLNAIGGDFIWDDIDLVLNNPLIKNINNLGKIFTSELYLKTDYYRPLQILSYLFDYRLYGLAPWGYHLTNIIIHILNALLIFFIFEKITENLFISLASSLLFICAPFNTEAVTYISGRSDLLLGLCVLCAFFFYIKGRYVISLLFFMLSLLSKEQAIIFPLFLPLYDFYFKKGVRVKLKYYSAFLMFGALYIILRMSVLNFTQRPLFFRKVNFALEIDFFSRALTFFKSVIIYLKITFFPIGLHMGRKMEVVKTFFDPYVIAFLAIFLLFLFAIVKYREKRRLFLFGSLWFFIMLLPQSCLVFPLILAEHFLYLPCAGIFLISGILLERIWRNKRKCAFIILGIWLLYYASLTVISNARWKDPVTFYNWTLRFSPFSYKVHFSLGNYYADGGQFDSALKEYRKVVEINETENVGNVISSAVHHNIGTMLSRKGLPNEAEEEYKKSIELNPESLDTYNDLGCLYIRQGALHKAEEIFSAALKIDPKSAKIYYNLGVLYAQKKDFKKSVAFWEKALEFDPNYKPAEEGLKQLKDGE